jgi:ketosteroid isomerase-like protein
MPPGARDTARAMSQENVEVVRSVIDAFNRHDPDLLASYVAAEGEADWSRSIAPYRGVYSGPDEWRDWFRLRLEAWSNARWEPLELMDLDRERVLLVVRLLAQGRDSGVEVTASSGIIWTVRDGKVHRAELFQNKAEALEAVGLRE